MQDWARQRSCGLMSQDMLIKKDMADMLFGRIGVIKDYFLRFWYTIPRKWHTLSKNFQIYLYIRVYIFNQFAESFFCHHSSLSGRSRIHFIVRCNIWSNLTHPRSGFVLTRSLFARTNTQRPRTTYSRIHKRFADWQTLLIPFGNPARARVPNLTWWAKANLSAKNKKSESLPIWLCALRKFSD